MGEFIRQRRRLGKSWKEQSEEILIDLPMLKLLLPCLISTLSLTWTGAAESNPQKWMRDVYDLYKKVEDTKSPAGGIEALELLYKQPRNLNILGFFGNFGPTDCNSEEINIILTLWPYLEKQSIKGRTAEVTARLTKIHALLTGGLLIGDWLSSADPVERAVALHYLDLMKKPPADFRQTLEKIA